MSTEPPTLDDAAWAVMEGMNAFKDNARLTSTGHEVVSVEDDGADRYERLVTFTLARPDGTRTTFTATITEEEEAWEPE
jgi:hypothetical protein